MLTYNRSTRIDRLFNFEFGVSWTCGDCGAESESDQPEFGLSVSIEDPKKDLRLVDYVKAHLQPESMRIRCDSEQCQQARAARDMAMDVQRQMNREMGVESDDEPEDDAKLREREMTVSRKPKILVVQLKRFKWDSGKGRSIKISNAVPFPGTLDLFQVDDGPAVEYRLHGVVAHRGTLNKGHYIAAVRRQDDRGFATIDDERVENGVGASINRLLRPSSIAGSFDPYVLIYVKADTTGSSRGTPSCGSPSLEG